MSFSHISAGFRGAEVLCGPSLNLEFTIEGELVQGDFVFGDKNLVVRIDHYFPKDGGCRLVVHLPNGEEVLVNARKGPKETPAGSSVNVAKALHLWGQSVGVFGPIGPGTGGETLRRSLESHGVEYALCMGMKSTPRTLSVLDHGQGSTLFMVKPTYDFTSDFLGTIEGQNPSAFVATGVKSQDLGMLLPLFRRGLGCFRAITFSKALILQEDKRTKLLELTLRSDLLQINRQEALLLLGEPPNLEFTRDHLLRLQRCTQAAIVVVTLSQGGSMLYDSTNGEICEAQGMGGRMTDSSGAGDAHLAALIWGLFFRHTPLQNSEALCLANFVAGRKCQHIGPWSGLPATQEMESFLLSL